jgi:hypothetical protein
MTRMVVVADVCRPRTDSWALFMRLPLTLQLTAPAEACRGSAPTATTNGRCNPCAQNPDGAHEMAQISGRPPESA